MQDNASLFYFIVLVIVIGGSAFMSGRFGENVRNLALWGVIILGLLIGYSYKDRIISMLNPGDVPEMIGLNTIEISRAPRSNHFDVQAQVNGERISALVDTGASELVLTYDDAEKAGIDVDRLRFNVPVSTANGMTESARARVGQFQLADHIINDINVMVARPDELGQSLIGMTYLRNFSQILIEGDTLTLKW